MDRKSQYVTVTETDWAEYKAACARCSEGVAHQLKGEPRQPLSPPVPYTADERCRLRLHMEIFYSRRSSNGRRAASKPYTHAGIAVRDVMHPLLGGARE